MELKEAIKTRMSIRGFKPEPVPREVLAQVLDIARYAPSGLNAQPWEFIVLTGNFLERAKQVNVEKSNAGAEFTPDLPGYTLTGMRRQRQIALGKQLFQAMDIGRHDMKKRHEWANTGFRFFDAPAAILVCLDEDAFTSPISLLDVGIVTQTIALAALEFGLGTCIQYQVTEYAAALHEALGIPYSKRLIVGLAIGYPDWDFPANKIRSERDPLENLVTWMG